MVSSDGRRRPEGTFSSDAPLVEATRELLTPSELANRWAVTTGHLANLRHQREGVGYLKIGSRVAYRVEDVLAYENAVYIATRAEAPRIGA